MAEETLRLLGLEWHGTSPDGRVTVEPVYCLGLCACGPAAMVDGCVHGRLDAARMRDLLEGVGA
jgi:formate dehydrogenase subunit gamma